jgi:hypothetical protein
VYPNLASQRGQREAEPERNPEELLRRESVNSEEYADDGACRGDAESDGERAQHPLAVFTNPTMPDVPERFRQREQEQDSEDRRRCRLVRATNRHLPTHRKRRHADDIPGRHEQPTGPTMLPQPPQPNRRNELEGTEHHEQRARNDVNERQDGMLCEARVKLRDRARADAEQEDEGTSRRRRDADEREDDDAGPDQIDAPRRSSHLLTGLILRGC